jgi:hypothetical protein
MTDLQEQIRAWTDAAVADVAPVTAEEALARPRPTPRRAPWLVAAAVLVALGLVLAIVATRGSEDGAEVVDQGPVPSTVVFDVLGVSESQGESHTALRSATTTEGIADLWTGARLPGAPPEVDLSTSAVVSITIFDDLCAPTLERFDRTGPAEITPVFVETAGVCEEAGVARTYVVAIEWASVDRSTRVALPAELSGQAADRGLAIAPALASLPDEGSRGVWPLDATTADRSTPEATARSFVRHVLGPVEVETADVSGSGDDEPHRVDVTIGSLTTFVLVAPIDGWVVMQMGETGLGMTPDPPTIHLPPLAEAQTVELLITTDRSVTDLVEDAARPETAVDLPPGTLLSVAVVQRAEDGTLVGVAAGHF